MAKDIKERVKELISQHEQHRGSSYSDTEKYMFEQGYIVATMDAAYQDYSTGKTSINNLVEEAHQNAVEHGWWEEDRNFGELIALMHSELSEALEEYRNGHKPDETYYNCNCDRVSNEPLTKHCRNCGDKPEGIPSELADVVIRVFDTCGRYGIDLEEAIRTKMVYNKTRPYRHGKKKA